MISYDFPFFAYVSFLFPILLKILQFILQYFPLDTENPRTFSIRMSVCGLFIPFSVPTELQLST